MGPEAMTCPDCGVVVLGVNQALLHECGVVLPEPETAEEPVTLKDVVEAIEGLSLQVNGIGMSLKRIARAQEKQAGLFVEEWT